MTNEKTSLLRIISVTEPIREYVDGFWKSIFLYIVSL